MREIVSESMTDQDHGVPPDRPQQSQTEKTAPEVGWEMIQFKSREDRTVFIYKRFNEYLQGKILDVGCDKALMRDMIGANRYTGIDVTDEADVRHNIEGVLPFPDKSFDTVLCIEVLEHVDNLHQLWNELIRVTKKHLVISLPNCWNHIRARLRVGYGSVWNYGLPIDPPVDRHKWFFNLEEAQDFCEQRAERDGLEILEMVALERPRPLWVRLPRRLRYLQRNLYLNRYTHCMVCIFTPR